MSERPLYSHFQNQTSRQIQKYDLITVEIFGKKKLGIITAIFYQRGEVRVLFRREKDEENVDISQLEFVCSKDQQIAPGEDYDYAYVYYQWSSLVSKKFPRLYVLKRPDRSEMIVRLKDQYEQLKWKPCNSKSRKFVQNFDIKSVRIGRKTVLVLYLPDDCMTKKQLRTFHKLCETPRSMIILMKETNYYDTIFSTNDTNIKQLSNLFRYPHNKFVFTLTHVIRSGKLLFAIQHALTYLANY